MVRVQVRGANFQDLEVSLPDRIPFRSRLLRRSRFSSETKTKTSELSFFYHLKTVSLFFYISILCLRDFIKFSLFLSLSLSLSLRNEIKTREVNKKSEKKRFVPRPLCCPSFRLSTLVNVARERKEKSETKRKKRNLRYVFEFSVFA